MKLKENDLQFEDFGNFYPAKTAYEDTYMETIRSKASHYAFPHIHHIFTLIRRAAKNGEFKIEYDPLSWNGPGSNNYTEHFLRCAGYKTERIGSYGYTLKISWEWDKKMYVDLD
ncbi:hypothetical protein [Xenorhabdus bovienii]|uniref:hypothetical protein n=1 Tax=Xenorhabdus bovienii TaxID=40576 RepID=UPI0023B2F4BF|nr:hypothetical protein [Xenorhabdus bovienii]MDE9460839.1 hypothetical protein [Xenorhabdus bovienii]MDE9468125.1 hypothetical protein [Xenorhabdus bovienii]